MTSRAPFPNYPEGRASGPNQPGEPLHGYHVRPLQAPNRFYRIPGFTAVAQSTTGNSVTFQFQQSGWVIGISCTTLADGSAAGMSSLGLRVTIADNNEELFSNGSAGDFAVFSSLVGTPGPDNMFPLLRRVYVNQNWIFQVKNYNTGAGFTPEVGLWFVRDPEGVRYVAPDAICIPHGMKVHRV